MRFDVLGSRYKSSFSKSAFTLAGGTAVSQLIPIVSLPVITRIYNPLEIGQYSLYYTIAGLFIVVVFLKYDAAIVLPPKKQESQAFAIVHLSFLLLILFSFALLVFVHFFHANLGKLIQTESIVPSFLYFISFTIFFYGLFSLNVAYLVRSRSFKLLSFSKILYSTLFASLQILFGFLGAGTFGMIIANLMAYAFASVFILKKKTLEVFSKVKSYSFASIFSVAVKYKEFPIIDLPTTLLNVLTNQIPVMFVSSKYGIEFYGYYMLSYKVLMAPSGLISRSVLDVFKTSAITEYTNTGSCEKIWKKVFTKLLVIAIIPFLIVLIFSPLIFRLIFGEEWIEAGQISQIFAVPFFLAFFVNPLSYTFYIANKQKYNFMFNVLFLFLVLFSLLISNNFASPNIFFIGLAIAQTVNYILYLLTSYRLSLGTQPFKNA